MNSDAVRQLRAHSSSSKTTYAYYFTEDYTPAVQIWPALPSWIKKSAFHGDELPYVFGNMYNLNMDIWTGKFFYTV